MYTSAVILSVFALCGVCIANTLKFRPTVIEDETELLLELLSKPILPERFKPQSFFKKWGSKGPRVSSFVWKNCAGDSAGATFSALTVQPDPLKLPGTISIATTASIKTQIQAPLQTNLTIEKKVGTQWVKIPCVDNFGSCTYDDLCDILYGATCPDPLTKAGIPCVCPFKPKTYSLPQANLTTYLSFPAGDYHMQGSIGMNGKVTGCLDVYLSVVSS